MVVRYTKKLQYGGSMKSKSSEKGAKAAMEAAMKKQSKKYSVKKTNSFTRLGKKITRRHKGKAIIRKIELRKNTTGVDKGRLQDFLRVSNNKRKYKMIAELRKHTLGKKRWGFQRSKEGVQKRINKIKNEYNKKQNSELEAVIKKMSTSKGHTKLNIDAQSRLATLKSTMETVSPEKQLYLKKEYATQLEKEIYNQRKKNDNVLGNEATKKKQTFQDEFKKRQDTREKYHNIKMEIAKIQKTIPTTVLEAEQQRDKIQSLATQRDELRLEIKTFKPSELYNKLDEYKKAQKLYNKKTIVGQLATIKRHEQGKSKVEDEFKRPSFFRAGHSAMDGKSYKAMKEKELQLFKAGKSPGLGLTKAKAKYRKQERLYTKSMDRSKNQSEEIKKQYDETVNRLTEYSEKHKAQITEYIDKHNEDNEEIKNNYNTEIANYDRIKYKATRIILITEKLKEQETSIDAQTDTSGNPISKLEKAKLKEEENKKATDLIRYYENIERIATLKDIIETGSSA
jgi:hypothetical protein